MSIRRLFWLGAAILFFIAALVAIAAVLGGSFGDTQGRILATCGIAFVSGAAALAGWSDSAVWTLTVLGRLVTTACVSLAGSSLAAWLGTLVPATWAASSLAAAVWAGADGADVSQAAERLVGTLGNIDVLAVRGDGRSVTIGKSRTKLASSEGIVLRERS